MNPFITASALQLLTTTRELRLQSFSSLMKMKNMLLPFFFLILSSSTLFFPSIAFASPTSNPPPTLSLTKPTNLTAQSLTNYLNCIDVRNPFTRRPKYPDCIDAIAQLPSFDSPGAFHNHGHRDPFSLPREETVRSCTVKVVLDAFTTMEAGSWEDVKMRAGTLNRLCFMHTFPMYKAAWGRLGRYERVVVSLSYPGKYEGGGGDGQG